MFKNIKFLSLYSVFRGMGGLASDIIAPFYVKVYLFGSLFLNILNWAFVYFINIKISQDLAVLHYNVNFGVNLIGSVKQIYILPFLGLVIFIFNFALFVFVFRLNYNILSSRKFFAHILLGTSVLANFFLLISLALIYLVNFYR